MSKKPHEPHDPTDMSHPLYDPAKDPLSPFYDGNDVDLEHRSDGSTDDGYKVGPGFPPKQYKWKKGCPSPYPKGRPRKPPSIKPDLRKALEDAFNEKVSITKGNQKKLLTKATLGIQQLVNQFAKGDRYARRDVLDYASKLGVDLFTKEIVEEALGADDQAIVDAALRRMQKPAAGAPADDQVKAPPDLLDDDVNKPESNEDPKATPKRKVEEHGPVLDQDGQRIPVSDPRHVRAMRERNLAEQKKNQGGS